MSEKSDTMQDENKISLANQAVSELIVHVSQSMKMVYKSQTALSSKIRILEKLLVETRKISEVPSFDDFNKVVDHLNNRLTNIRVRLEALNARIIALENTVELQSHN